MSERPEPEDIDWSLTTWEGHRRAQMDRWASMSLDQILETQEEMAELGRMLAGQANDGESPTVRRQDGLRVAERGPAYGASAPSHHDLALPGCTPEPLMAYLKGLGILRLLSEQKDPEARGWWKNDVFWLRSPRLFADTTTDGGRTTAREELERFFLAQYQPTPIVGPWGARSGFFPGSSERKAREALESILATESSRVAQFQYTIVFVRELLKEMGLEQKARDDDKLKLLEVCRQRLPDNLLSWLDACYVLTTTGRKFPPLLGTGGNEGSGSYVSGFAQQVVECLLKRRHDLGLKTALLGIASPGVTCNQAPGHFSPAAAGGPNAGQGFDGPLTTNAWDYLLCLEGACVWASAAVRRLGNRGPSMAAFPFTVNVTGAGDPGIAFVDQFKPKQAKRDVAEMWLPLWDRPTTFPELRSLISEGRATVAGRNAQTGVDLARAADTLGVDRGINAFQRTAFLMRNGQSFLGISLGRFKVRERREVDLLRQIDAWLHSFAWAAGDKKAPPRFRAALGSIHQAVFDLCRYGGRTHLQSVLVALGRAERELAVTQGKVGHSKATVRPIVGLSDDWITQVDTGTHEFAIARALATMLDHEFKVGPLRANLEPADWKKQCRQWAERDRAVVWHSADLRTNLSAVLERRLLDGARVGCRYLPLGSPCAVPLTTLAAFLNGELDDARIDELIWGLMLIDDPGWERSGPVPDDQWVVPRAYALLKLLFLSRPLIIERRADGKRRARVARTGEAGGVAIRPEPSVLPLLRGGRVGEACAIAMRRLRASGLDPMPKGGRGLGVRDDAWRELDRMGSSGIDPWRLAAALLIPIREDAVRSLIRLVIRGDDVVDDEVETVAGVNLEGGTSS